MACVATVAVAALIQQTKSFMMMADADPSAGMEQSMEYYGEERAPLSSSKMMVRPEMETATSGLLAPAPDAMDAQIDI